MSFMQTFARHLAEVRAETSATSLPARNHHGVTAWDVVDLIVGDHVHMSFSIYPEAVITGPLLGKGPYLYITDPVHNERAIMVRNSDGAPGPLLMYIAPVEDDAEEDE